MALWAFAGPLGTQGCRALTLAGAELGMSRLRQDPTCPGWGAAGTQVAEALETRGVGVPGRNVWGRGVASLPGFLKLLPAFRSSPLIQAQILNPKNVGAKDSIGISLSVLFSGVLSAEKGSDTYFQIPFFFFEYHLPG